jgi:hypothetical protein
MEEQLGLVATKVGNIEWIIYIIMYGNQSQVPPIQWFTILYEVKQEGNLEELVMRNHQESHLNLEGK